MIVEFGQFALVFALLVSLVQSGAPLFGLWWLDARLIAMAVPATLIFLSLRAAGDVYAVAGNRRSADSIIGGFVSLLDGLKIGSPAAAKTMFTPVSVPAE